tara:strand:- start:525 stop:644 length:120 start_codon:yes stop_codon:yes gene_type:complete
VSSRYNHKLIESKWQETWEEENVFKTKKDNKNENLIITA